ncbi:MAG TPA: hypothetical protein VMW25_02010, partial [Clostridia bacterium]|nr:hypothetical protein [Clostridia bacterium]
METGGFLQEAEMLAEKYGVTGDNLAEWQHIADKKAPLYGALSGAVEYIGNAFGFLGALKKGGGKETSAQVLKKILANPTAKTILMKFAKESLGIFGEGAEEVIQGGLMNAFMTPAVIEMRKIDPDFAMGWEPRTGSELLEQGVKGAVVAGVFVSGAAGAGAARRSKLRSNYKNQVKQSEQIKQNQARETELKNAETQADLEAEPETPFSTIPEMEPDLEVAQKVDKLKKKTEPQYKMKRTENGGYELFEDGSSIGTVKKAEDGKGWVNNFDENNVFKTKKEAHQDILAQREQISQDVQGVRDLVAQKEQESPVTETETPVTAIETAPVYTPEQQQEMKRYIRPVQHIDTELETASEPRLREALEDNKELIQDRLFSEATNFGKVEKAAKELEKRNIPYVYGRGDIDNMKAINDKYGDNHPRANEDIRALLEKNLVGTINDLGGIIGRDQGDELKWVVPGKTKVEVDAAIEKGRKNILIEMKKLGLDKLTHIRENVPNYGAGDISYGNLDAKPGHYKENNDNAEAMTKLMKVKKLLNAKKNSNVIDEGGTNDVTKRLEGNGDKSQSTTGKTGTSIGKETQQQTPKSAAKTDGTTKSLAPEFEQPQTVPIDIMESLYGPPEDNDQHQKAKDNVKA